MTYRIRNKLVLLVSIFSIVPVVVVGIFALKTGTKALMDNIGSSSVDFTNSVAGRINDNLLNSYSDVLAWSKYEQIVSALESDISARDNTERFLKEITHSHNELYYIALVKGDGIVIASSEPEIFPKEKYFDERESFKKALNGQPAFDKPRFEDTVKDYSLNIYVPVESIRNDSGISGVLVASLKWSFINEMITGLEIRGKPQSMADHVMMTANDGMAISCYDPEEMFVDNLIKMELGIQNNHCLKH